MKISLDSFLAVVKRSGLVPADRLQAELEAFQSQATQPADAEAFAAHLVAHNLVTAWQTEKLLLGKHKGFFLGKYRLLSLLGKGGMSSVYLAEHVLMRRRCAIKVLPAKRVNDTSYLGRFHREAQAVAALDHPNIVRAYDVDHEQDGNVEIHFLVMEYVDGSSLLDLVNRDGTLSPVAAAEYVRQAAQGLEHAHRAGLIHRDVKPGNLLVDSAGVVKVMDLGLARFFAGQDEESLTIQYDEKVLGTADYLAPEQAVDSHAIDARADIYSLGCTLYFLLTGHPPFPQGTLPQRLMAHQTKEPPPIENDRADVPPPLIAIVRRMMAKKPEERYATAAAAAEALAEWLAADGGPEWEKMRSRLAGAGIDPGSSTMRVAAAPKLADLAGRSGQRTLQPAASPAPAAGDDNLGAFLAKLSASDIAPAKVESAPPATPTPATPTPATPQNPRRSDSSMKRRAAVASRSETPPAVRPDVVPTPAKSGRIKSAAAATSEPAAAAAPAVAPAVAEPAVAEAVLAEPIEAEAIVEPVAAAPAPSSTPVTRVSRRRAPIPKQYVIYGGAGAAVMIVGIALIAALSGGGGTPAPAPAPQPNDVITETPGGTPTPTRPPRKLPDTPAEVAVGPDGHFASINEALAYALENPPLSPNEPRLIKVAGGETYAERLEIANWNFGLLTIRSEGEKRAVLKPTGSSPVLTLQNSSRVRIEGLRIDAAQPPVAVRLSGVLNGVQLHNLEVVNFKELGIDGDSASGLNSGRFELTDLILLPGATKAHGLRFSSPVSGFGGGAEYINLTNITCSGPADVGLKLSGTLRQIAIRRCRLSNLKTGIELGLLEAELDRVTIENNTLNKVARGIVLHQPPARIEQFVLQKNLFLGVSESEVLVNDFTEAALQALQQKGQASYNWTDRSDEALQNPPWNAFANQGKTAIGEIEFASTEPGNASFLKPTRSDLRFPQAPGNDKYIGAINP